MIATASLPLCSLLPDDHECPACGESLRETLARLPSVAGVHLAAGGTRLLVHFDSEQATAADLSDLARAQAMLLECRLTRRALTIDGMDCADCARTLGEGVRALGGVTAAEADFIGGQLHVTFDAECLTLGAIEERVRALGYSVAGSTARHSVLQVEGLDCADCARTVEQVVAAVPGVESARLSFTTGRLEVAHAPAVSPALLAAQVKAAGYTARPLGEARAPTDSTLWGWLGRRELATIVATLGLVLGAAAEMTAAPELLSRALLAISVVVGGWRTARAGVVALRATRAPDMNLLMTIAVLGALAIGEWIEAATIVVLFSVGSALEAMTMERARRSIGRLLQLAPAAVNRLVDGRVESVSAEEARVGDQILVRPGERVPLDGVVAAGLSAVDQAPITGESIPVDKAPGDAVFAGTVNGTGALTVDVTRPASDSTLAHIVRLVEQAQAERAPVQRLVDQFARWYTPAVIAASALIAVVPPLLGASFHEWFYRGLVLLVIACPCALVISTPVAIVAGITSAARRGILIKSGAFLEALGQLRALAFDKTGTLTHGRPRVTDVLPVTAPSPEAVLALAAGLEDQSEHPIAAAVVGAARRVGVRPRQATAVRALPGQGVEAIVDGVRYHIGAHRLFEGHPALDAELNSRIAEREGQGETVILLADDMTIIGLLTVADEPRHHAPEVIASLRRLGLHRLVLLTGDNQRVAHRIAATTGVPEVAADLLPEDKVAAVARLGAESGRVGMIGDGINDTPALARADVGIAMGAGGTAAALEAADVALMNDDLRLLPSAIQLSRRTLAIIRQNVAAAVLIKVVFVTLAVLGLSSLWMAVAADMGGSLLVTLNALRLLRASDRHST